MFTDGVSEALNVEGEEFGEERIVEASLRHRELSAEALHHALLNLVTEFCGDEFEDDATVLVVAISEKGDDATRVTSSSANRGQRSWRGNRDSDR